MLFEVYSDADGALPRDSAGHGDPRLQSRVAPAVLLRGGVIVLTCIEAPFLAT